MLGLQQIHKVEESPKLYLILDVVVLSAVPVNGSPQWTIRSAHTSWDMFTPDAIF